MNNKNHELKNKLDISKETTYELIQVINQYNSSIKRINEDLVNYFSSNDYKNSIKKLSNSVRSLQDMTALANIEINDSIKNITNYYNEALSDLNYDLDNIKSIFLNTAYLISQSQKTNMIKNIRSSFTNGEMSDLINVLNSTIKEKVINASDISFFKISHLVEKIDSEIIYPKGIKTSIDNLNKETAFDLISNDSIQYNTTSKYFISKNGSVDSNTMNVICRGKKLLHSMCNEELFSEAELIDFNSALFSNQSLAIISETGTKILAFIQDLFETGEKTLDFDKELYYHSRSREIGTIEYTFDQMLRAPAGLPEMGRFNMTGRSYYYFASTKDGAEAEVKKHLKNNKTIQTIKISPKRNARLLDLSNTINRASLFLRHVRFPLINNDEKVPSEYLLPCFVGDCCRRIGFDGIKYKGSENYDNYVVWEDGFFTYAGICV